MREDVVEEPEPDESNPLGLPARTVKEAQVMEFGPVTFPAYEGASAGVRSITDEVMFGWLRADPSRLRSLAALYNEATRTRDEEPRAAEGRSAAPAKDEGLPRRRAPRESTLYGTSRKEGQSWRL